MTTTPGPISGTLNLDGVLKCGCRILGLSIQWCELHAAAPEMLALLAALSDTDYARLHHGDLAHAARALLAKIEGKEST